ncbi:hypothetical protein ACFYTQ_37470 [Nocardia sp. NPDC004068]|uniref:hypothetical protein n=1 Tax=Nocardia sp. NPDC004068 TaxID=3364303 RepID=UPI0036CFA2C5
MSMSGFVFRRDDRWFGGAADLNAPWLDLAESRLRELVDYQGGSVPTEVAELLVPECREELRLRLWSRLRSEDLVPVPGGCEVPWSGCPDHGDLMEGRAASSGWWCSDPGHRFGVDVFGRLRHCQRPAIAVLSGLEGARTLAVCEGHRYSEVELASYGGEPVTVTDLGSGRAA